MAQFDILIYALVAIGGAILYAFGDEVARSFIHWLRDHGLSRGANERLKLKGVWYAAWQTTTQGKEVLNSELLRFKQKGSRVLMENVAVSPENRVGGYLWRGQLTVYNNQYMIGHYLARQPYVISKGSLFFKLDRVRNHMIGKWVGCNIDSEFTWGFGVIAKDQNQALTELGTLVSSKGRGFQSIL